MHTLAPLIPYRTISAGLPKLAAFCTLCQSAVGDMYDIEAMERIGCCRSCEQQFYEPNREKWLEGWRPDKETVAKIRDSRLFFPR
jgi:hypothetical protein